MPDSPLILFAGGGTGGHIFPNLAIFHALRHRLPDVQARFLVSTRAIDRTILEEAALPFTALPAHPMTPRHPVRFLCGYRAARRQNARLIADNPAVRAVIATGGFVSAPAMAAARRAGLLTVLVNLDAVPGRANRLATRWADQIFTVYRSPVLAGAEPIAMPLRPIALASTSPGEARTELGLDPDRRTLLITAGSQGAASINQLLIALVGVPDFAARLSDWQVLHLAGVRDVDAVRAAYAAAGIPAVVEPFCQRMGLAWAAADCAVSRAGASSVAEVWANAVPTLFLPYPYHRDQHQRLNAQPLVDRDAAEICLDRVETAANVAHVRAPLTSLLTDSARRERMREILRRSRPADGAACVADWLTAHLARNRVG